MKKITLILVLLILNSCGTVNEIIGFTEYSNWGNPKKLRKKVLSRIIYDRTLIGLEKDFIIVENFHLPMGDPESSYIIACSYFEKKVKKCYYFSHKSKIRLDEDIDAKNLTDSISFLIKKGKTKEIKKYEEYTVNGHGYIFVTILDSKKKLKKTYSYKEFFIPDSLDLEAMKSWKK
jgi:hypothetical protein